MPFKPINGNGLMRNTLYLQANQRRGSRDAHDSDIMKLLPRNTVHADSQKDYVPAILLGHFDEILQLHVSETPLQDYIAI